ncbi:MAG: hypothetical protein DRG78_00020 [Epsilonproteobacteria bacterium]|nr:MAG: hypothetical protein DRG78_00020 [Campylobacterota bacterium]
MSRWINNFENHPFQATWEDLKIKLKESEVDETIATSVEELARLKKVVAFIDNGLEGFDPELASDFSDTTLARWNQKATECKNDINSYNTTKEVIHISNANQHIDVLLGFLRLHILYSHKFKKSILASLQAYTNEVDKHLKKVTDTEEEYKKAKEFRNKIEKYYNLLLHGSDDSESLKLQITKLFDNIEDKYNNVNKFYESMLIDNETVSIKTKTLKAQNEIMEYHDLLLSSDESSIKYKLNNNISNIEKQCKDINIFYEDSDSKKIQIEEIKKEIEDYHYILFENNDDTQSIKTKIEDLVNTSEEKYKEINEFYNETLAEGENESTKTVVINAKEKILKDADEAAEKLLNVSAKIGKLDEFYVKIFGSEDDEGVLTGGLKKEIEQRVIALDKFKTTQEENYTKELDERLKSIKLYEEEQKIIHEKLHEKILSYLPDATSAGLSESYRIMKESFEKPIRIWNGVFLGSIGIMFIITLISTIDIGITKDNVTTMFAFKDVIGWKESMNDLLSKLPLYAPIIWIALFASKRRSESRRLEQEYAHKETLAKSYVGYKKQIEELDKDDAKLLEKLLDSSIDTVSHNASESLDKNHGDSVPTVEIFEKLIDKLNIPKVTP